MPNIRDFHTAKDPHYTTLATLGRGAFGVVTKVQRKSDGKFFACKVIRLPHPNMMGMIIREIQLLSALSGCRNIIQWNNDVSMNRTNMEIHLHMTLYSEGDLNGFIEKRRSQNRKFSEPSILIVFEDLASALGDCHAKNILHRDIKPANIMMSTTPERVTHAYLGDFGIGKFSQARGVLGTATWGTPVYMAPESLGPHDINRSYTSKSDVFAVGCVIYEMCELRRAYKDTRRTTVPQVRSNGYSAPLRKLVADCMALSPAQRIGTTELVRRVRAIKQLAPAAARPGNAHQQQARPGPARQHQAGLGHAHQHQARPWCVQQQPAAMAPPFAPPCHPPNILRPPANLQPLPAWVAAVVAQQAGLGRYQQ